MNVIGFIKRNKIPLLLLTPLRAVVILIMPFFLNLTKRHGTIRKGRLTMWLLILFFFSSVIGLVNGTNCVQNTLLSWYIVVPIIIIFTSSINNISEKNYGYFISATTIIVGIIDFIGYFTYAYYRTEDEFGIPYGHHFNNVHGLSILNAILFFFFFTKYMREKHNRDLFLMLYFIASFIMCFYGVGLVILLITMTMYFIPKLKLKMVLSFSVIATMGFLLIWYANRSNIEYIGTQLGHFEENSEQSPRKIQFLYTYLDRISESSPVEKTFGFGPGSYNGRIAFLLNEEASNPFTKILGNTMPKFHEKDVFPYWNKISYDNSLYRGGTANKPNSSLVSICAEDGFVFAFLFFGYWIIRIKRAYKNADRHYLYSFLYLTHLFLLLNCISEQWLETSEFLFYAILCGLTDSILKSLKDAQTNSLSFDYVPTLRGT